MLLGELDSSGNGSDRKEFMFERGMRVVPLDVFITNSFLSILIICPS